MVHFGVLVCYDRWNTNCLEKRVVKRCIHV